MKTVVLLFSLVLLFLCMEYANGAPAGKGTTDTKDTTASKSSVTKNPENGGKSKDSNKVVASTSKQNNNQNAKNNKETSKVNTSAAPTTQPSSESATVGILNADPTFNTSTIFISNATESTTEIADLTTSSTSSSRAESLPSEAEDKPNSEKSKGKAHGPAQKKSEKTEKGSNMLGLYIGLGVGVTLLLIFVAVGVGMGLFCLLRKKKTAKASTNALDKNKSVSTTTTPTPSAMPPKPSTAVPSLEKVSTAPETPSLQKMDPPPKSDSIVKTVKTDDPIPEPMPDSKPPETEKKLETITHAKIDPKKFKMVGKLVMNLGKKDDPMVHQRAGEKSTSVKHIIMNDELNEIRDIGTDIEHNVTEDLTVDRTEADTSVARKKEKESYIAEKKAIEDMLGRKIGEKPAGPEVKVLVRRKISTKKK